MKRICAWCGQDMGDAPGPATLTTHGICDSCKARELARYGTHTDTKEARMMGGISIGPRLALKQRKEKDHEDPDVMHTFVCILRGNFKPRPRSYRGTYTEARKAAWGWLEENYAIQRIISESGEVVAERDRPTMACRGEAARGDALHGAER